LPVERRDEANERERRERERERERGGGEEAGCRGRERG
jgi:hypothetical protein